MGGGSGEAVREPHPKLPLPQGPGFRLEAQEEPQVLVVGHSETPDGAETSSEDTRQQREKGT